MFTISSRVAMEEKCKEVRVLQGTLIELGICDYLRRLLLPYQCQEPQPWK